MDKERSENGTIHENVMLYCAGDGQIQKARELTERYGFIPAKDPSCFEGKALLVLEDSGMFLYSDGMKLKGDLSSLAKRIRVSNLRNELLIRAAGLNKRQMSQKELLAVDATAGMGEDALLLAAAGCRVIMYENDPAIFVLLEDALKRAKEDAEISSIACRMELVFGDSIEAMKSKAMSPDIILLDPMFPERAKSGFVKKKFQILHILEAPCENEEELLKAALLQKPGRIVIKRPLKGPFLGGVKPVFSIKGKAIRYDCVIAH